MLPATFKRIKATVPAGAQQAYLSRKYNEFMALYAKRFSTRTVLCSEQTVNALLSSIRADVVCSNSRFAMATSRSFDELSAIQCIALTKAFCSMVSSNLYCADAASADRKCGRLLKAMYETGDRDESI